MTFYGNHSLSYTSESHHSASLEALGHDVIRLQEPNTPATQIQAEAEQSDLFVWVMTHGWVTAGIDGVMEHLKQRGVPRITYHLDRYRDLPRWDEYVNSPFLTMMDHWFTVDQCQADWLNDNTNVQGHYLPPGVFGPECYMAEPGERFDVAFVGSRNYHPQYPMRAKLVSWLRDTYGDRFRHYGGDGLGTVRGADLNQVYANARVVVGDSLILDPDYPGKYWSDRVPESLGRGALLLHPWVYGLDEHFTDGEHLVTYEHGNFDQLKFLIDYYLDDANTGEREQIRKAGHEHVKATATYRHRWESILDTVFG